MDLRRCRLYGILDLSHVAVAAAEKVATEMINGGVDVLQLRGKKQSRLELEGVAETLLPLTRTRGVPFVINDYPEIARAIECDAVHVGQDDIAVVEARAIAGPNCLVGKSTHSVEQAVRAAEEGADYLGFGPLYATPTKPDYAPIGIREIAKVHKLVNVPIFCIGGIKLENLADVINAGARRIVIVSGLLQAPDVAKYARTAREMLSAIPEK